MCFISFTGNIPIEYFLIVITTNLVESAKPPEEILCWIGTIVVVVTYNNSSLRKGIIDLNSHSQDRNGIFSRLYDFLLWTLSLTYSRTKYRKIRHREEYRKASMAKKGIKTQRKRNNCFHSTVSFSSVSKQLHS